MPIPIKAAVNKNKTLKPQGNYPHMLSPKEEIRKTSKCDMVSMFYANSEKYKQYDIRNV